MNGNTQYEVALSFAGEQREYVETVARALQRRGVSVFYDKFEETRLWGLNLAEELQDIYENRAKYVVIFVSKEYVSKSWPTHERQASVSRAVQDRREYILPVHFDDSTLPGLPTATKYLLASAYPPADLASMICDKLGVSPFIAKASDLQPPRMTSLTGEAVFDYSNSNGRYIVGRGDLEFETMWTKADDMSIHVYNDPPSINGVALAKACHSIAAVTGAAALDFSSRCRTVRRDGIVVIRNSRGFYAAVHVLDIRDDSRGHDQDELRFRYVIQADKTDRFDGFSDDGSA